MTDDPKGQWIEELPDDEAAAPASYLRSQGTPDKEPEQSVLILPVGARTLFVWLLWAGGVGVVVFLTFGPMFDSSRRGGSTWTWIVAGLLLGPLSGVAYYSSRWGIRLAQRREAALGRHRGGYKAFGRQRRPRRTAGLSS